MLTVPCPSRIFPRNNKSCLIQMRSPVFLLSQPARGNARQLHVWLPGTIPGIVDHWVQQFKGIVSRDELYFFDGLKNQISTCFPYMPQQFLNFFAAFLWRKEKIKFWLASMKRLTNCENPSSNPFQIACCSIQAGTRL